MAAAEPTDSALAPAGTGAGPLRCVVVTPERAFLDTRAEFVAIPLIDGELGIAHGRSPLIGRVGFGELRVRSGPSTHRYYVDGGFAQVRDDVVTVLTGRVMPASGVDLEAARAELAAASARVAPDEAAQAEKTRAVERARALVRVGDKRA